MDGGTPDSAFDRSYFDRLDLLVGEKAASELARLRVAVFGVGGVGGWCAESLVRSGVGHLAIVDSDRVCESNVNRQVMATAKTVGEVKVHALKERLLSINPAADITAIDRVYTAETSPSFELDGCDYVIDAIDSLRDKAHLINAVTRMERPVLFSSMGAALKMDPFRIRKSEFWKVTGDGLARALRAHFRKTGEFPAKKFMCVWSDEVLPNRGRPVEEGESNPFRKVSVNGTVAHVTAIFGFALAGLVLQDVCAKIP